MPVCVSAIQLPALFLGLLSEDESMLERLLELLDPARAPSVGFFRKKEPPPVFGLRTPRASLARLERQAVSQ